MLNRMYRISHTSMKRDEGETLKAVLQRHFAKAIHKTKSDPYRLGSKSLTLSLIEVG